MKGAADPAAGHGDGGVAACSERHAARRTSPTVVPRPGMVRPRSTTCPIARWPPDAEDGNLITVRTVLQPAGCGDGSARGSRPRGSRRTSIEGASFNPLVNGIGSGVQLQVGMRDRDRAESILGDAPARRRGRRRRRRARCAARGASSPTARSSGRVRTYGAPWLAPVVMVASSSQALGPQPLAMPALRACLGRSQRGPGRDDEDRSPAILDPCFACAARTRGWGCSSASWRASSRARSSVTRSARWSALALVLGGGWFAGSRLALRGVARSSMPRAAAPWCRGLSALQRMQSPA